MGIRKGLCTFVALEKHECKKMNEEFENKNEFPRLPECSGTLESHKLQNNDNCRATRDFDDLYNSYAVPWNIQNCVIGKDQNSSTISNVFKCERGNL